MGKTETAERLRKACYELSYLRLFPYGKTREDAAIEEFILAYNDATPEERLVKYAAEEYDRLFGD